RKERPGYTNYLCIDYLTAQNVVLRFKSVRDECECAPETGRGRNTLNAIKQPGDDMKTTKMTPAADESLRQAAYNLAGSPDADPSRLEAVVSRLHKRCCRTDDSISREQYELAATGLCLTRWKELPSVYENPLDDDEKLEEMRRLVFGCAPGEEP